MRPKSARSSQKRIEEDHAIMKEISIPLECLDIDAFLDRTIDYLSLEVASEIDPT